MTPYNRDYFIAKFEAIPDEKWTTGVFVHGDRCCALGHCGPNIGYYTPEAFALSSMLGHQASFINDGFDSRYLQPTPKQRILAALRDLPA